MNYWWVNQSKRKGSAQNKIIWAPEKNQKGDDVSHWDSLFNANVGDKVFHYTDGYIVGVSDVTEKAVSANNPYQDNEQWGVKGKQLSISFREIKPIPKSLISKSIRIDDKSVFDKNGNVKQGYFYLISDILRKEIEQLVEYK